MIRLGFEKKKKLNTETVRFTPLFECKGWTAFFNDKPSDQSLSLAWPPQLHSAATPLHPPLKKKF